jgi:hypothetical protein
MRLLFWKKDKKRPHFSEKKFEVVRVSWSKTLRQWVENPHGKKWGLHHPAHGRLIGLRKAPEKYGRVIATPDLSTKVILGTPSLEEVEKVEEEE